MVIHNTIPRILLTVLVAIGVSGCGVDGSDSLPWNVLRDYSVGDIGPAGGIIFHDRGDYSSGWRYLEARTDDFEGIWAPVDDMLFDALNFGIGVGELNTHAIVAYHGGSGYAAEVCLTLDVGGFDDWFLPSFDELRALYNLRDTVGGFADEPYWTSTQDLTDADAQTVDFLDGSNGPLAKNVSVRFRPIRAF
jgi:hypothetical protein